LCDVFEDWKGPIQNHEGQQLYVSDQEPGRYPAVPFAGLESLAECERQNIADGTYRPATMNDLRRDLFRLIDSTEWLDWQLLTKRPENIKESWPARSDFEYIPEAGSLNDFNEWNRDNVWIGTSVSEQKTADENIPKLLECAQLAPVLFVSAEPLLGPIDLRCLQHQGLYEVNALTGSNGVNRPLQGTGPAINWVIAGGESGAGARHCRPKWIRSILRDCRAYSIPVFVKQMGAFVVDRNDSLGGWEPQMWPEEIEDVEHDIYGFREEYQGADIRIRLRDPKGGNPVEWPPDLRVRQFPAGVIVQQ
jgi:protein gp37